MLLDGHGANVLCCEPQKMTLVDKSRKGQNFFFLRVGLITESQSSQEKKPQKRSGNSWTGVAVSAKSADTAGLGRPRNTSFSAPSTVPSTTSVCSIHCGRWARTRHTTAGTNTNPSWQSACCCCCSLHQPPPHWLLRCPLL